MGATMRHNFNFPSVKIIDNYNKNKSNIFVIDSVNSLPNYITLDKSQVDKLVSRNTDIYFVESEGSFIFLNNNKSMIKALVNKIKELYCTQNKINLIFLGKFNFNFKIILSEILLANKNEWSLKTKQKTLIKKSLLIFGVNDNEISKAISLAKVQSFVQQLVNLPSNYLTPNSYVKLVKEFITDNSLTDKISFKKYGKNFLKKKNMGAFLGVAKGSKEKPVLMVLEYRPNNEKPVVFVGKGLTFDSGGISIKPSLGMDAMKGDMAGSAAAIGALLYAAFTNSQVPIVSIAACCENMPSHKSVKPGDILIASNGTSIEVLDTDAEGRLVLADALHYSKKFKGRMTIDLATLTGACVVALGSIHSGLFTRSEELACKLYDYSISSGDLVWRLPLVDEHKEFLESKVADISNLCLGKGAGASNGAIFLEHFAPTNNWVHLDIAGSATPKGVLASGRPLPFLSELIDKA